jgi:hypothetical protein
MRNKFMKRRKGTVRWGISILLVCIPVLRLSAQRSQAQITTNETTISEPGLYKLEELYKYADIVALVEVLSGDIENYEHAVYKAKVVKSFKGTSEGETIYFGPYKGDRLGWEYVLFLRNVAESIVPKTGPNVSYGRIHYAMIFNEGYSSMETSYKCIFDGEDISQHCDHGVRICTDYIILPPKIPAFPPEDQDMPFGCRWVRKGLFISTLENLQKTAK